VVYPLLADVSHGSQMIKFQRSSTLIESLPVSVKSKPSGFAQLTSLTNANVYNIVARGIMDGLLDFLQL
jgi:hypothetical protein